MDYSKANFKKLIIMKTFNTIMLVLLMAVATTAQNKVNIVIFSDDADPFYVVVNGVRQNTKPETHVRISDLNMESFSFVIIFSDPTIKSITRKQYLPFGYEYSFRIKKDKKGNRSLKPFGQAELNNSALNNGAANVVYHTEEYPVNTTHNSSENTINTNTNGSVNVNNNTGTYQQNTANTGVNTTNTVTTTGVNTGGINTTTNVNTTGNSGSENVSVNVNMNGVGFNMNVNVSGTENESSSNVNTNVGITGLEEQQTNTVGMNTSTTTTVNTTVNTTSTGTGYNANTDFWGTDNNATNQVNTGYNNQVSGTSVNTSGGCYTAINNADFQDMKKSVSSKSFSETKLNTAKQATKNNCLSALQVKEMMQLFNFEGDRLEYAKFAYDYTVDKNNYYKVNDAFTFESSMSELDEYIKNKK